MEPYKEAHYRSVIKALSWRVFATVATITIVYLFTRRPILSLEVGLVEAIVKLVIYYFHERIWSFIGFGKKKHPLSSLEISDKLSDEDVKTIKEKLAQLGYIEK
jgi:uncharacterized membrane protein